MTILRPPGWFFPTAVYGGLPFDPSDLTLTAWYDPSDLDTLFQDSAGTTPVTADGDVVGLVQDKSGNGHDWIQATTANKPLYKTSGGLHRLQFDGVNDVIGLTASLSWTTAETVVLGMLTSDSAFIAMAEASNANGSVALWIDGTSSGTIDDAAGNPTYWADAAQVTPETRVGLQAAYSTGAALVAEVRNIDLSTGWNAGFYFSPTSFPFAGDVYGLVIATEASMSSSRANIQQWMADKSGVTL